MKFRIFEGTKNNVEKQVNNFLEDKTIKIQDMQMTTNNIQSNYVNDIIHFLAVTYNNY